MGRIAFRGGLPCFARRRIARRVARRTARRTFYRMEIAEEDAKKIEQHTGQPAASLTEEELVAAMKKLGITKLEVDS